MKKSWIPWIIIAVLGLTVAFMGGYLLSGGKATPPSAPDSTSILSADVIGEDAAKAIALAHANVSEKDVSLLHIKRDQEDGRSAYDVDFVKDGAEYEYKINAADGAVLSYDCDTDKATVPPAAASSPSSAAASSVASMAQSTAQPPKYIGDDAAKAAAFAHAGVSEKDASFIQISFDSDDGRAEYDIEFRKGFTEYDYKIDAATGRVLNYEVDNN